MKICPIMSKYVWEGAMNENSGLHDVECFEERCAWWEEKAKKCVVQNLASIARILGNSSI